jgi:hypothetical protein
LPISFFLPGVKSAAFNLGSSIPESSMWAMMLLGFAGYRSSRKTGALEA